ncbi:HU family DNA-binding protein [Amedibacterium intestinale]|uniref:Viral histone-like protein n=1 Tax=Amedibacterium intestinale TaxID=2583452 RepID=A0A6N4TET7_9FIRM|nr:HU family DNA-binding protein [Amedibacterium intestinale]BBK21263.1 DNA-binding protein HU-beta [Amedibacterium intestinale]
MMSKKGLIEQLSEITGLNQKETEKVIEGLVQMVQDELAENGDCKISGLGKFAICNRPERMGVNPATKEKMTISASKSVKFKPCKKLKEKIK